MRNRITKTEEKNRGQWQRDPQPLYDLTLFPHIWDNVWSGSCHTWQLTHLCCLHKQMLVSYIIYGTHISHISPVSHISHLSDHGRGTADTPLLLAHIGKQMLVSHLKYKTLNMPVEHDNQLKHCQRHKWPWLSNSICLIDYKNCQIVLLAMVSNLATRWCRLNWLQILLQGGAAYIICILD